MRQTGIFCLAIAALAAAAAGCGGGHADRSAMQTPAPPQAAGTTTEHNVADVSEIGEPRIAREVHHELVMLPFYGVFDNLGYRVNGGTVTLMGQVTRPTLKSDAERVVKSIEGVQNVNNQIQVLPVSDVDDRIRIAEYRAIYSEPGLQRYALQAIPPIHIIVNNGNVTLEGVVATQMDKELAGTRANQVPNVFAVTNNLQVRG